MIKIVNIISYYKYTPLHISKSVQNGVSNYDFKIEDVYNKVGKFYCNSLYPVLIYKTANSFHNWL